MNIEKIKERLSFLDGEINKNLQIKASAEQNLNMLYGGRIECAHWISQLEKDAANPIVPEAVE